MDKRFSFRNFVFFKDVPDEFLKFVMISYPWDEIKFTQKLTGVPHHVMLMADMKGLRRKFDSLRAWIKGGMQEMMDDRGVSGS